MTHLIAAGSITIDRTAGPPGHPYDAAGVRKFDAKAAVVRAAAVFSAT